MFIAQVERLCAERGLKITPLVKSLGISPGNVVRWRNGTIPSAGMVLKFANYFNVGTDYLLKGEDYENDDNTISMKVFDEPAAAGFGSYLSKEDTYEMLDFPSDEVPRRASCGIRIRGKSMEPKIHSGDIVWVEFTPTIDSGEIGIFVYDEKSFCKRLEIDYDKRVIRLVSLNRKYDPIVIRHGDELRTIGRVLL